MKAGSVRKRIVGVDFGTKRVGVAISDPLLLFSQPYGVFSPQDAVRALRSIDQEDGIETIVVGWPLTLQGTEEDATEPVQQFINRLRKAMPEVRIEKWDERFTSERAKQMLHDAGLGRRARREKGRVDTAAAGVILQEYLDERRTGQ